MSCDCFSAQLTVQDGAHTSLQCTPALCSQTLERQHVPTGQTCTVPPLQLVTFVYKPSSHLGRNIALLKAGLRMKLKKKWKTSFDVC